MHAKELIQSALTASHHCGFWVTWLVEGMIPTVLLGERNPVAEWQKFFGENSEPLDNANGIQPSPKFGRSIWS